MQTPPEIIIAYLASLAFWLLAVLAIWVGGQKWSRLRAFCERAIGEWKLALGIAIVYAASVALRGSNVNLFSMLSGAVMTFCQAIIGLALARSISGFEPAPVVRAAVRGEHVIRNVSLMIGIALLAVAAGLLAGGLGSGIARALGEGQPSNQGLGTAMPAAWQLFFYFLSGAGIAEETVYRLVVLSLIWRLTRRPWVAVVLSGLLFGAYHLTPLDGMYLNFWQYPLTQFFGSALIGMVWGVVYLKRGYETAVLAHTLSDWLPVVAFMAFAQ